MGKTWPRQHAEASGHRRYNLHYLDLLHLCHECATRCLGTDALVPIHLDRYGDSSGHDTEATCTRPADLGRNHRVRDGIC